jgi:hypothetical protein
VSVSEVSRGSSREWTSTATRSSMQESLNKLLVLSGKFESYIHYICHHFSYVSCSYHTYRLFPKKVELQALMKYYDVDGDGNISYEEFLRGLR